MECIIVFSMAFSPFMRIFVDILVVLAVYVDSYFFIFSTSIIQVGIGTSTNMATCEYASPFRVPNFLEPQFSCVYFSTALQKLFLFNTPINLQRL